MIGVVTRRSVRIASQLRDAAHARRREAASALWSDSTDRWSLSAQLMVWMALMLAVAMLPALWLAANTATRDATNEAISRARAISTTLASSALVIDAAKSANPPAVLDAPIEAIRAANDVLFIIVISPDGIRWSHVVKDRIGDAYLGSTEEARAGGVTVDQYAGTLGPSYRVVVPAYDDGRMVAMVSTGISVESVNRIGWQRALQLLPIALLSLVLGASGVWIVSRRVHRQTHGLGPWELGRLYTFDEAILHTLRAAVVMVGHDGTVVRCNDEALRLIGMPEVQPGQRVTDLQLDPDLSELMSSGQEHDGVTVVEDGRVLVATQLRAVFEGEDLGWVTTLHDRTDLVRLTGELSALQSFSELMRSRAHEADNRMHTMSMLVELGRDAEAVQFATAAIAQSQALIDQVTGAVADAPLAALLLGKFAQADELGVTLRLSADLEVPDFGMSSMELLVIIGNLIDNGIEAAAAAPAPRWVEVDGQVETNEDGAVMVLRVTDSGPGISPDLVAAAFRRGWSTKSTAGEGPAVRGIGLSLVEGTVRRMGGSLSVTTDPSRFEVRVPVPSEP